MRLLVVLGCLVVGTGVLTPVAQALMNKKAGEEVDLDLEGAKKRFRVDSIAAARPA